MHVITRLLQAGAEENTISTCLHQVRQGHRVTLVHGPDPHPSWALRLGGQIDLVEMPTVLQSLNPLRDGRAVWALRNLFVQLQPDVVHTHQSKAGILGRLAAAIARVPLVVHTVHIAPFLNVGGPRRRFYVAAEKICQHCTHLFISVSHGMREAFWSEGIGRQRPFEVIHSGMPLAKFITAAPVEDWKSRIGGWDRPGRPKFILMLAAFEPRKRHREFLEAIAGQLHALPDTCILFAGEGPEQERCEALVRELGMSRQVRFLGHDRRPEELIALADICLLTSGREGLPRSAVQYIAGGKPVVLTRLPGIEELIVDGVNGVITDPDDLGDTVTRIKVLLNDDDGLSRLAAGARATDVSRWREEAMGERIEAAYNRTSYAGVPVDAIEFFGLPGAGKTAVARNVAALLRQEGRPVRLSSDIMGDKLGLWGRSVRRLALIARVLPTRVSTAARCTHDLALGRGTPKDMLKSLWNFYSVLAMSLSHNRRSQDLLISDQGLIQAAWSARVHGPAAHSGPDIASMLRNSGRLDRTLFVNLMTPTEIARSRIERRKAKTSRMQMRGRVENDALWVRAEEAVSDLALRLEHELGERSIGSRLVRVPCDTRSDPTENAKAVVAHLRAIEASWRGGQ